MLLCYKILLLSCANKSTCAGWWLLDLQMHTTVPLQGRTTVLQGKTTEQTLRKTSTVQFQGIANYQSGGGGWGTLIELY